MKNEFRSEKERLNEALHLKTKQLINHLNRDQGPSRSRQKDNLVKAYYEGKDSDESEKERLGAIVIKRFVQRHSQNLQIYCLNKKQIIRSYFICEIRKI